MHATSYETVLSELIANVNSAGSVDLIVGTDSTREEAALMKEKVPGLLGRSVKVSYYNGTHGVQTSKDDKALDHLLRHRDHTANTRGVEDEGITVLANGESTSDVVIYFRNGRAGVPKFKSGAKVILWGVWNLNEVKDIPGVVAIIPGLSTVEKAGSYKNVDGIVQKFHPAIQHKGTALAAHDVVNVLARMK
jgi:hypothetical protein